MFTDLLVNPAKPIWKRALLLTGFLILIILAAYIIASTQDFYKAEGKDFISLWLAPRLLLEGKDPYNPTDWVTAHDTYGAEWVSDQTFLYPYPLAVILLPLGLLPLQYAAVIWVALSILAILFIIQAVLNLWKDDWPLTYLIPVIAGIFLFRAVAVSLWLGQIDWLILLCVVLGMLQWEKRKWAQGMMLISISVIKPQLGAPLLLFISLWLILRHHWKAIIGEGFTILALFGLGWLFNHDWAISWLHIGGAKIESLICCTPTIWGLSSLACKFNLLCGSRLGMIASSVLSILLVVILARRRDLGIRLLLGLCIPISLLVSPYLWTYSHISLLLPILVIMGIIKHRKMPYMLVAPFPLYMALLSSGIVFLSIRVGVDVLSSLVPLVVFGLLLLIWRFYGIDSTQTEHLVSHANE
jgi:hypothetical protein